MNLRLLPLIVLVYFSQMNLALAKEKIWITGFARLLEDDIFLSNADMNLDVYDWDGNSENPPHLLYSSLIRTNSAGRFNARVEKGKWFRLSLLTGEPPNINEAMAVWMQHAIPGLKQFSNETVEAFRFLNPRNVKLLNYISIDSGFMPADKDYVGQNREISFQVPLEITANILKTLIWSVYGESKDASSCQLVVTALSPKDNESACKSTNPLKPVKDIWAHACPTKRYQPDVQNLSDCPHGARGVTFSSEPESRFVHYFGINDQCKTDLLAAGLSETTRDGGAFLVNISPPQNRGVSRVRGRQNGTELPEHYFLCEPGKIINISPPQGPAGLKAEQGFTSSNSRIGLSALVGIVVFAANILLSPFSTVGDPADNSKADDFI